MLGYIKKFVLDSFPSIIATIVGAYIVHHYVIPAASPQPPANAVAVDPAAVTPASAMSSEKATFEKAVAEKSAIEKTAGKATEKATESPAESKRRRAAPRIANRGGTVAPETTGSLDSAADERRDANELARAAIERLRNAPAPGRTVALAPPAPVHTIEEPARGVAPMQPLPPAVAVKADVFNGGSEAALPSPAPSPDFPRAIPASNLTPPAEIPEAPPIELHAEAQSGRSSITEDVVSAAKSVFHAVIPR